MEQFDIALISSYHQDILSVDWVLTIGEVGKRGTVITPNPNEYEMLMAQGAHAIYLKHYFPPSVPPLEEIEAYFKARGVNDLKDYVATEKSYYFQSDAHLIAYAYQYAFAFERIFAEIKINAILHPVQGGEVVRRTAALIADLRSVSVIFLGETFIPGTMNLYSDEFRTVLKPTFHPELSAEKATEVINDKISRKPVVHYSTQRRRFKGTPLLKKMYTLVKDGNWNILRAYIARKKSLSIDYVIKAGYTKLTGVFKPLDTTEKYFYYPFNVDAESELFIRNPGFVDQVAAMEKLAKVLPKGYKLYVKTHPGVDGHLSIRSYRRLRKIKNVVPLKPTINSFDVVKHSQGVVMASSTVGLESYIMGKATCVVGLWPYTTYGNFVTVNDLSETFDRILTRKTTNDPVKFVQNLYRDTIAGSIYGSADDFKLLINNLFEYTHLKNR
ncbi:hypothetical protein [Chryseolinea soli]|uniref:Capsule biosynthesis protein n=1 Tax=Chryseolinea soli TaxID=2321403 RepID=A0A385SIP7_9BACT|nr:hypothetical protein [Chryseolinea soli]AYB31109.1 hypothetical protein D4L85_11220 [Chryseolinea soli]